MTSHLPDARLFRSQVAQHPCAEVRAVIRLRRLQDLPAVDACRHLRPRQRQLQTLFREVRDGGHAAGVVDRHDHHQRVTGENLRVAFHQSVVQRPLHLDMVRRRENVRRRALLQLRAQCLRARKVVDDGQLGMDVTNAQGHIRKSRGQRGRRQHNHLAAGFGRGVGRLGLRHPDTKSRPAKRRQVYPAQASERGFRTTSRGRRRDGDGGSVRLRNSGKGCASAAVCSVSPYSLITPTPA